MVCGGFLGLIFRLIGVLVTFSFRTLFRASTLANTISMAPRMVSFNLAFISFQKKLFFCWLSTIEQGF